eukprot:gene16722-22876_t
MSMYIRLKRKNQTIFLHVEPSNTFAQIKQRVSELLTVEPHHVMLIGNDKKRELLDLATISDQEVVNDEVIYFVFAKETGGGWEEVNADTLTPFGDDASHSTVMPP